MSDPVDTGTDELEFFLIFFFSFIHANSGYFPVPLSRPRGSTIPGPRGSACCDREGWFGVNCWQYDLELPSVVIDGGCKVSLISGSDVINSAMHGWLLINPLSLRSPMVIYRTNEDGNNQKLVLDPILCIYYNSVVYSITQVTHKLCISTMNGSLRIFKYREVMWSTLANQFCQKVNLDS